MSGSSCMSTSNPEVGNATAPPPAQHPPAPPPPASPTPAPGVAQTGPASTPPSAGVPPPLRPPKTTRSTARACELSLPLGQRRRTTGPRIRPAPYHPPPPLRRTETEILEEGEIKETTLTSPAPPTAPPAPRRSSRLRNPNRTVASARARAPSPPSHLPAALPSGRPLPTGLGHTKGPKADVTRVRITEPGGNFEQVDLTPEGLQKRSVREAFDHLVGVLFEGCELDIPERE